MVYWRACAYNTNKYANVKVNPGDIIELKNINYSKQNEMILQDINIRIEKGEIVAIMGHNGSGKSTLI